MRKVTFFLLSLCFMAGIYAQRNFYQVPDHLSSYNELVYRTDGSDCAPSNLFNPTVHSDAALEVILGETRYDRQTNMSTPQRNYLFPDGTMGASWMRGMNETGFSDRGTGYNYYNGTSWLPIPSGRIEASRTGWPSYAPFGPTGELVVAHQNATSPLLFSSRAIKGTGNWEASYFNPPAGASGLEFARVVTGGPDHQTIHLLCVSGPTQFGGTIYNDMDGALLYSRSLDGGQTWDIENVQLPGINSSLFLGMDLDGWAWATPHGDTIAFVVGGHWVETFLMISYDNGVNWTKQMILNNSQCLVPEFTVTVKFACSDAMAVELDNQGVAHVVFSRMFSKGETDGQKYYPYTDGLVYWNSTMPVLHDSLFLDTLEANGQLVGYIPEAGPNDSIHTLAKYGTGLTSMPMITIDEEDNIYVLWSSVSLTQISPDDINYRHIWARGSNDHGVTWSDMLDLNADFIYNYQEFVYPAMSKTSTTDQIHYIYQTSDIPGSGVVEPDVIGYHTSHFEYRAVDKQDIIPYLGVDNTKPEPVQVSQILPNPAHGMTKVLVSVPTPAAVSLSVRNLTGQLVMEMDKGTMAAGTHALVLDAGNLVPGIYFCTVTINTERITRKMIVK